MKLIFVVFLLVLYVPIWVSRFCSVGAVQDPLIYFISSPVSSPTTSFIPPVSASMTAFAPGTLQQKGIEEEHKKGESGKRMVLLLIFICGALVVVVVLSLLCCWNRYWKLSRKRKNARCSDVEKGLSLTPFSGKFNSLRMVSNRGSVSLIDYKVLENGTNNFGDDKLLGRGGFGRVYEAQLEDNLRVAVKKLDCGSEDAKREFENEVDLLSKIHNPNIISLMGYGVHEDNGFVIYELMQNGSLEDILHGPSRGSSLSWHTRLKIALDIARGLEYLHECYKPAVIHRDLKSSNILLDANFNAKLSDFGLAVADSSHCKNKLKLSGTVGYVAPEYMLDGELTEKSDVYAFGIVLLELLLGRRPVEKLAPAQCQSIVTWAMPQLTNRASLPNIVDPVIKNTMDEKYLFQVCQLQVITSPYLYFNFLHPLFVGCLFKFEIFIV
uniref:Serine/threonine-protein kinase PBS1 n=1 Tax=Rhizophora mucronata TaxID=61149 RepID=A0A2P2L9F0_RHIMU